MDPNCQLVDGIQRFHELDIHPKKRFEYVLTA